METWKHLRGILLLPFMVTVVIPGVILWLTGPDTLEVWQSALAIRVALPILGGALICLGLVLMVATIRLFVSVGKGTLAAFDHLDVNRGPVLGEITQPGSPEPSASVPRQRYPGVAYRPRNDFQMVCGGVNETMVA